jgi:hypothetical protein
MQHPVDHFEDVKADAAAKSLSKSITPRQDTSLHQQCFIII